MNRTGLWGLGSGRERPPVFQKKMAQGLIRNDYERTIRKKGKGLGISHVREGEKKPSGKINQRDCKGL